MIMSQQNEIGTLVVVVLKAQHLHQPSFYKQDPYGQASLGGLKKRTKTAPKGGQHPVWDEELRFPVPADVGKDKANRMLEVACYKEVQRGEDVLLGKGMVDIEETLKTGEFDDWVPLETAAGTRGEVYLEMTFYANSPPPVMRRPSKLSPFDRLAHPAQDGHPPPTIPPAVSPQPGRSPIATERKPSQPPPGSGNQIPASLIPALGPQSQGSRQPSPGAPVTTVKHRKDSLPPLPVDDTPDVGSEKNPEFPAALQPGGRSGPRPMPPQNRNRVTSVGRSPPESLPGQLSRKSLSDTPALRAVPPFTLAQTPTQSYSPETTPTTGQWPGLTPSIVVEEHPSQTSSVPLPSPLGPSQTYMQQAFIPAPAQGTSRTFSPFQPQPQQHYDMPLPHYQQYTQYLGGPTTPQPLPPSQPYPQLHNTQPGQQQPLPPYSSQQPPYPPQLQHYPPYQQPYLPPPQQHHSQHIPYIQTPHPLQVQQPYEQHNLPTLLSSNQPVATQQSPHPQTRSYPIPPPPPPVQPPTPQTHTQPYFSPPPPPPPLTNHGRKGSSVSPPVVQPLPVSLPVPSQGPIPSTTSLQQTITLATPTFQSSATLSPSQATSNDAPPAPADTQVILGQNQAEEKQSMAERVAIAETGVMTREARDVQEDARGHQTVQEQNENVVKEEQRQVDTPKPAEGRGVEEERESGEGEEKERRREEGAQQEEVKQQEEERTGEDEVQRGEEPKEREEQHKRMEDEQRSQAEEELRKKNEEECRQREERRRREEEEHRTEEERRRKEEEEHRMEEERKRREEVERMKVEEEHRRKEEHERREKEERRRREGERKRREEERIQHEREEAERRRKIVEEETRRRRTEEAEAERRWQEELARIRARTEQEAADAAFARAQMEADEAERRQQEEADLAFLQRAQEEADREEMVARERTRQLEADMEVARREQAHEEELERRRQEQADRELARRLDMELNLGAEFSSNGGDWSRRRRAAGAGEEIR